MNELKENLNLKSEDGLVVPILLWWLGAQLSILLLLWLFGML